MIASTPTQAQGRRVRPTSNLIITEEIFRLNLNLPQSKRYPNFRLHMRRWNGDEFIDYKYEARSANDIVFKMIHDGWWWTK